MKKLLLILILTVPLFSGCSRTEVLDGQSSASLSFDTHIGKSSRAVAVSRFQEGDAIGVYMYQSPTDWATDGIAGSGQKMANTALRLDAGAWIYNPTQFWKQGEKYTFFAYAPYKENAVVNNGVLTYTVGTDETTQEDLLYSVPSVQTKDRSWDGSATVPDKVQFVFTHALSQVKFSVATENDYSSLYTIELTGIKLHNIYTIGNLNLISENSVTEPWGGQSVSGSVTYSPAALTLGTSLQAVTNASGDVWMLLPQTLPDNAEVEFTVHLTKVGTMGTATDGDYTLKAPLRAGTWEHNKVYNYQVTLNMDQILGVRSIVIGAPKIIPWEEEPAQEIHPVLAADVPEAEANSTATEFHLIMSYMAGTTPIRVISQGSGLPWTVTVDAAAQSWLRLADSKEGTGAAGRKVGEGNRLMYAYVSDLAYNGADRSGTITLSRAEAEDITIRVTQGDFAYVNGVKWARGNLRLNGNDIAQDQPNYAGLYFKGYSLIGMTLTPAIYSSSCIGFKPAEYSSTPATWVDVPYSNGVNMPASYDAAAGIGDICQYLSDKKLIGASGTTWRLPTKEEAEKLVSMPEKEYGDYVDTSASPAEPVTSGWFIGKNAASATVPGSLPQGTVFIPAGGDRHYGNGDLLYYNSSVGCWTSTFSGNYFYQIYNSSANIVIVTANNFNHWGKNIRCIRNN